LIFLFVNHYIFNTGKKFIVVIQHTIFSVVCFSLKVKISDSSW